MPLDPADAIGKAVAITKIKESVPVVRHQDPGKQSRRTPIHRFRQDAGHVRTGIPIVEVAGSILRGERDEIHLAGAGVSALA